jgi:DNA primase
LLIPQDTINEIKTRIDIVDVIGDFVNLKRSGQAFKGMSPFTNEKTPSFFVVPAKGIYKCFSSGKGGDAINFIMEYDGLSYTDALKYLAGKYGIEIVERELTDEDLKAQNERESLFIINNFAKDYFIDKLKNSDEGKAVGLSYFQNRGLQDEDIEKFELGYSLESWDDFLKHALEKGFSNEIIQKAGMISSQGEREYDRFRGRVMFPIHNQTGKVIAFGARTLKKDKKVPKYLNSPETDIYFKSKVLYGLHLAKGPIRKEDNCYLVEGYTDVISLHHFGIQNVVSSSGTALTIDQIQLLSRFSENVTVLFDGDPAGVRASLRGIDMLLEGGLNVKSVMLPEGQDPDSYSRELGSYEFKKFLDEKSEDFITFKVNLFVNEAKNDPVKKASAIKDIVESVSKIPDPIKRSVYIKETSGLLDMEESILISELNKIILKEYRKKQRVDEQVPPLPEDVVQFPDLENTMTDRLGLVLKRQERENIRSLLRFGLEKIDDDIFLYEYLFQELEEVNFSTPVYGQIYNMFKKGVSTDPNFSVQYIMESGNDEIRSEVIEMITDKYELSTLWGDKYKIRVPKEEDMLNSKAYSDMLRLKLANIRQLIHKNLAALQSSTKTEDHEKFQKIHMELKKSEKEISGILGIVISR